MKISSQVFKNNDLIPPKYTCNGEDINPPLEFSDIPESAKSLVLIVDDPDAPGGDWVHWVVYNIDPSVNKVIENSIPKGGIEGQNTSGNASYGGPCPPSGTHRYFFKLYALSKKLFINTVEDKNAVLEGMKNVIIDKAELMGLYAQMR